MPIICVVAIAASLMINAGEDLVIIIGRTVCVALAIALILGFAMRIRYRLAEEKWRRNPEVNALLEEKHELQEDLKQMRLSEIREANQLAEASGDDNVS